MSVRFKTLVGVAFTALAFCLLSLPTSAQQYPARDLHIIGGYAAGSGADVIVRYYADKLQKLAGKAFINRVVGDDPFSGNPDTTQKLLETDIVRWRDYIRTAKIEPQG